MRLIMCGLPRSTVFFPPYLLKDTIFEISYWIQNVCFDILCNVYLKHFSFLEYMSDKWQITYTGFYVKYPFLLSDFN
jgi:hypothetical protein